MSVLLGAPEKGRKGTRRRVRAGHWLGWLGRQSITAPCGPAGERIPGESTCEVPGGIQRQLCILTGSDMPLPVGCSYLPQYGYTGFCYYCLVCLCRLNALFSSPSRESRLRIPKRQTCSHSAQRAGSSGCRGSQSACSGASMVWRGGAGCKRQRASGWLGYRVGLADVRKPWSMEYRERKSTCKVQ